MSFGTQQAQQTQAQQQPQPQPQAQGGGYNPLQPVYTDPSQSLALMMQGYMPQAQQQQTALNNQLAAMGIVGGGGLDANLALQRQIAAGAAPTLGNIVQQSQMGNQAAANQAGMSLAQMLEQGYGQQLGMYGGFLGQGLGTAGNLAGSEANNFAVEQQNPIWGMLGQAGGMALGAYTGGLGGGLGGMFGGGGGVSPSNVANPYTGPSQLSGGGGFSYPGGFG